MHSAIYTGWVRHRRLTPRRHTFRYRLFMMYLDLAELDQVFRGRWLWSARRPAVAWFRRADYLGDPRVSLDQAVRDRVAQETGSRPAGPIRVLTHLRYFGYCFNPVTFYYCFDDTGTRVETIVAEITNTPWKERHCYVLTHGDANKADTRRFRLAKNFHVSPFMEMALDYDWRFKLPGESLVVHMENLKRGAKMFDATLCLERRAITGPALARALLRFPAMTLVVIAGIYWQALRLWLTRTPFHPHPAKAPVSGVSSLRRTPESSMPERHGAETTGFRPAPERLTNYGYLNRRGHGVRRGT